MVKPSKKEYSLYLEEDLVKKLDKAIFPLKRSNVVHLLILEYLIKKNPENPPTDSQVKQSQSTKKGDVS
jgi:metal-responsive CopG/Arc/MetJ family transcriptional regulator